eukprot:CAMPEP_0119547994 /NCGR_PEP_ID=MMETSP1352-20130426/2020_1 /TAXON_ID=265584 /ORGANISM="Stauroneis constricta, Strain CCMP1120" /LENGTH=248 /DNA_ID=CAMNT_0007593139 /DNA_START=70 /DNA_END=816 /DNA_ORIENTATION=-
MPLSFERLIRNASSLQHHHGVDSTDAPAPDDNDNNHNHQRKEDYRGFVFVHHHQHGLLLLKCTRKRNKPIHYQLPGGHVDDAEFEDAAKRHSERAVQLQMAAANGCARELFEETGIDVRQSLERRLKIVQLHNGNGGGEQKQVVQNGLKHRMFYLLQVTDEDFFAPQDADGDGATGTGTSCINSTTELTSPECGGPKELMLKLSVEHAGFRFEKSAERCLGLLQHHSGGKVATALRMACASEGENEDD